MKNIVLLSSMAILLAACGGSSSKSNMAITPDDSKIDYRTHAKGLITVETPNGIVRGYNQYASFYGLWQDNSRQAHRVIYRGKEEARNVPSSGKFTYLGNAVRFNELNGKAMTSGKSRIDIDFGAKTVEGEIKMPGLYRDIRLLTGHLNGTQYSGDATVFGNDSGRYYGGVFGENAQETAGVVEFSEDRNLSTAFGGTRF